MKRANIAGILAACAAVCLLTGCESEKWKNLSQANADLELGAYADARDEYLASAAAGTKEALSYRGAGIANLRLGAYEDAIENFTSALGCSKVGKEVQKDLLSYRATAELKAGSYEAAMTDCQTLAASYDMDADTWFLYGSVALALDSYDEASTDFDKSFELDGTYDRALQIYSVYLDYDMEADGTAYLEAALEADSDKSGDACDRGRVRYYMEDYEGAKTELVEAVNDGSAEAKLLLGMVYMAQNDLSNARTMYQEYVTEAAGDGKEEAYSPAQGYNGLALCDLAEGNYDQALADISSGLASAEGEDRQSLLFNEIVAYEKKLDFATALQKVTSYLEIYPNDEEAQKEKSFLTTRTGA